MNGARFHDVTLTYRPEQQNILFLFEWQVFECAEHTEPSGHIFECAEHTEPSGHIF